ncbi:hypothetical protein SCHPADRAFT_942888 [Schizopora paradoxa]|uniref:Uncharacterized protein n=1 Tax=Schizopora paradoxa TaxID=27342 RepID=A0A0H2S021_9AGAM|nr:hypothetical protein SCHPADRAFT_942888 [Schizopora paradoxa]
MSTGGLSKKKTASVLFGAGHANILCHSSRTVSPSLLLRINILKLPESALELRNPKAAHAVQKSSEKSQFVDVRRPSSSSRSSEIVKADFAWGRREIQQVPVGSYNISSYSFLPASLISKTAIFPIAQRFRLSALLSRTICMSASVGQRSNKRQKVGDEMATQPPAYATQPAIPPPQNPPPPPAPPAVGGVNPPAGGSGNPPAVTPSPGDVNGASTTPGGATEQAQPPPAKKAKTGDAPGAAEVVKKDNPKTHHVKTKDWPDGCRSTKTSMDHHNRYLCGTFSQVAVPVRARPHHIAKFEERFNSTLSFNNTIQAAFVNYGSYMSKARELMLGANIKLMDALDRGSTIAFNLTMLGEDHRLFMFEVVAAMGLEEFAPDITSSHDSLYNLAHERIATFTFRTIAAQGGYAFLGCVIPFTTDAGLMSRMYRNFVFSRLRDLILRETRAPGSLVLSTMVTEAWRRCKGLAEKRDKYITSEVFYRHTNCMVKFPDSVSDDGQEDGEVEEETGQVASSSTAVIKRNTPGAYIIHEKEGRNPKVTDFVRAVDIARKAVDRRAPNRRKGKIQERLREDKVGGPAPRSHWATLPLGVPLDYFTPAYYNSLTMRERHELDKHAVYKVGLPARGLCSPDKWKDWRKLPYDTFMQLHGDAILKDYDIPTAEDIQRLEELEKIAATIREDDDEEMEEVGQLLEKTAVVGEPMDVVNQ